MEKFQLPKKARIFISLGTLTAVLVTFNQCVVDKKSSGKSAKFTSNSAAPAPVGGDAGDVESENDLPDGLTMPPMNSGEYDPAVDSIDVGVKDFEQINATMSALTGVPTTDGSVQNVYRTVVTQLPSDNNLKSFLPAHQVAITKLAAEYCERLVENGTLRTAIWPNLNFTQNPNQAFTAANRSTVINQTIDRFMGPLNATERSTVTAQLVEIFDTLLQGEDVTSSVTTRKVVKGLCITSLGSAYVTLL